MAEVNDRLAVELSANVSKLLDGLKKASDATSTWGESSGRQVEKVSAAFNGVQFEGATSKLKAETLKMIELTHQLDVARIAGDKQTAAALQEQITLMQRIRQLRSAGFDAPTASKAAGAQAVALAAAVATAKKRREDEEAAEQAAQRREKITGNPSAALQSVFARTRVGVLEEGGSKIPLYGSALEELGVAGFAAAAGLAAVAVGGEEIKKSLDYAEDIEKTSKALGVTTTQLQEFDFAASGSSVSIQSAREGLQQFNEVFGKYSSGLANGRTAKFLDALGFTPESARQLGSTTDALDQVLAKLSEIKNPQQRASLASQLGLTAFLPVLAEGKQGVDDFTAAMMRAQSEGAVISPDQIKRAAELNDQLEQVEHTVGTDLKQAFIDLGPVILAAAKLAERLASGVSDIVAGFEGIGSANRRQAGEAAGLALDRRSDIYSSGLAGKIDPKTGRASGGVLSFAYNNHDEDYRAATARMAAIDAEDAADAKSLKGGAARDLSAPKKAKKGPADPTPELFSQGQDDVDTDQKALDSAKASLTANIQAHADAELKVISDENIKRQDDLDAQIDKINATKGLTAEIRAALIAQRTQASDLAAAAADAKSAKVRRDAQDAQAQADLEASSRSTGLQDRARTARASLSPDAQVRSNAELQNFRDQQSDALDAEKLRIANKQRDNPDFSTGSDDLAQFKDTQAAELIAKREQDKRADNPLYAYANPTEGVGEQIQTEEVKALQGFNDGLVEAITQSKNLGDVFHSVALGIASDLLNIALKQNITVPLANALFGGQNTSGNSFNVGGAVGVGSILSGVLGGGNSSGVPGASDIPSSAFAALNAMIIPGFANGTDDAPGGMTKYDEKGVEGYVPPGAQIIPNDVLRALGQMTPSNVSGGGASSMTHNINIDLTGANGDDTIRQISYAAAAHGTAQAIATSRSDMRKAQKAPGRDLTRF